MRRYVSVAGWMLAAAALAFIVAFWPQSLGGSVAYVKVDGLSMEPTLHLGDLAVVRRQSSYRVGDPVAYRIPKGQFGAGALVIHRLTGIDGTGAFITKGDNRSVADEWRPRTADILGKVFYDVPGAGAALAALNRPVYLGGFVAALTVFVMVIPSRTRID